MTFLELKTEVVSLLSYDGEREKHASFFEKQTRFALIDLQENITPYQLGHETEYTTAKRVGSAHKITPPEGAKVTSIFLGPREEMSISGDDLPLNLDGLKFFTTGTLTNEADTYASLVTEDYEESEWSFNYDGDKWILQHVGEAINASWVSSEDADEADPEGIELEADSGDAEGTITVTTTPRECYSHKLIERPGLSYRELICGDVPCVDDQYYAQDPRSGDIYIYPMLGPTDYVLIEWDGKKLTYEDEDTVNIPENATNAIHLYVQSKMLTLLDHDRTEGWKLMSSYKEERSILYSQAHSS